MRQAAQIEERMLALSTAHMPSSDPDFGDIRVIKFEEGYIAWLTEPEDDLPKWIQPIMKTAWDSDCTLILFDCDLCVHPKFDVWEW